MPWAARVKAWWQKNRHALEMKTCFLPGNRGVWNVLHGHQGFWSPLGPVTPAGEPWTAQQEGTFCVSDLASEAGPLP